MEFLGNYRFRRVGFEFWSGKVKQRRIFNCSRIRCDDISKSDINLYRDGYCIQICLQAYTEPFIFIGLADLFNPDCFGIIANAVIGKPYLTQRFEQVLKPSRVRIAAGQKIQVTRGRVGRFAPYSKEHGTL
jgi:hypothetical protein